MTSPLQLISIVPFSINRWSYRKIATLAVGMAGGTTGCEMFVDVEVPDERPRLVVNYVMGIDEPLNWTFRLTVSQSSLENDDPERVSGATVAL